MKRDMELVREVLKIVEEHARPTTWGKVNVEGRDSEEVSYHVKLLAEAGYLNARNESNLRQFIWGVNGLTWEGHEFLDSIRDDKVWARVKTWVASTGGTASLEVVKELAVKLSKQYVLGADDPGGG